jgi:hypothetical protein
MKKGILWLFLVLVLIGMSLYFSGCAASGLPNSSPTYPTQNSDITGKWSGTWGSFNVGGGQGLIDEVNFERQDAGNGNYTITGNMKISGFSGGTQGTIQGTMTGSDLKFTATFDSGSSLVFEGAMIGTSVNGAYKRYENNVQSDNGTLILSRY